MVSYFIKDHKHRWMSQAHRWQWQVVINLPRQESAVWASIEDERIKSRKLEWKSKKKIKRQEKAVIRREADGEGEKERIY